MDPSTPTPKVHEALDAIEQYFSDMIPPFQAAEALELLLDQPPQLLSIGVINWISAQFRISKKTISIADYIYRVAGKLQYLGHLQLVTESRLTPYLDLVKQQLLEYCPIEERAALQDNFNNIDYSETSGSQPFKSMYHKRNLGESYSDIIPSEERCLAILWDRLKTQVRNSSLPGAKRKYEASIPNLVAMVVVNVKTNKDFLKIQVQLQSLGFASGTDHIFRTLSQGLPGWVIISPYQPGSEKSNNPVIKAMTQIVRVAEDKWESGKRFQELVQAAIEQFNAGSLARTVTMLDLALSLIFEGALEPAIAASVRKTAHQSLDMDRLRDLMKKEDKYPLLHKVLNFFDEYTVPNMLNSLQQENKRERRKFLLGLLKVHGNEARNLAFERLKMYLASATVEYDWFFARNLLCTVNSIPRSNDIPIDSEMRLVTRLLNLDLPAPLVKEAITYAGQVQCSKSENLLIATAEELEKIVIKGGDSDKLSLLDRVIFTLAHYGTPNAYRVVVKHGVSGQQKLGDTASRLVYLSSQNLASDQESLSRLIKFLKSNAPRKLLGMMMHKNDAGVLHVIRALSSTPVPSVREVFKEIADQFPDTKFGIAAGNALKEFETLDQYNLQGPTMSGALALFGLPDLLLEMNASQHTGTLTIRDINGNPRGKFLFSAGRIRHCSAGHLEGIFAAYQLLEIPVEGSFLFHGRKDASFGELTTDHNFPELGALLMEGMRRYDEWQRVSTILPDSVRFQRSKPKPEPPMPQDNKDLFHNLWQKTAQSATPEECEANSPADSCSIRALLVRWLEEGALVL
jgi:hypothetical protein